MNSAVTVLIIVLVVAGGIGIAYASWLAAKKRREAFAALAAGKGWTYVARDDARTDDYAGSPFGEGHNRQALNVVTGTWDGRAFVSFDYRYYTTERVSTGKTTTTREVAHDFGVVELDTGTRTPDLAVTPENVFGRLVGRITGHDIELESEDFNRAFTVHSPDRKFASDVIHPRMMEFLLQHPDTAFRLDRGHALCIEEGKVPIESIQPRLQYLDGVLDLVPEFVWVDLRGGAS